MLVAVVETWTGAVMPTWRYQTTLSPFTPTPVAWSRTLVVSRPLPPRQEVYAAAEPLTWTFGCAVRADVENVSGLVRTSFSPVESVTVAVTVVAVITFASQVSVVWAAVGVAN